jgi:hypothetical protein
MQPTRRRALIAALAGEQPGQRGGADQLEQVGVPRHFGQVPGLARDSESSGIFRPRSVRRLLEPSWSCSDSR